MQFSRNAIKKACNSEASIMGLKKCNFSLYLYIKLLLYIFSASMQLLLPFVDDDDMNTIQHAQK